MRGLTADELLDVWERGRRRSAIDRTLLMLAAGGIVDSAEALTVGERDRKILGLRAATFGDDLDAVAPCPRCGERCAFTLSCSALLLPERRGDITRWRHGTWTARVRPPTVADLAAAATRLTEEDAEASLLERCVDDLRDGGASTVAAVAMAPSDVRDALAAAVAGIDPQADLALHLRCAACGDAWRTRLDIAAFLWNEIAAAARRLLEQVHVLAATYGWRERDILALTVERRDAYVRLCAGESS